MNALTKLFQLFSILTIVAFAQGIRCGEEFITVNCTLSCIDSGGCDSLHLRTVPKFVNKAVTCFYLRKNEIQRIEKTTFERYTALQIIDMNYNIIDYIEQGSFEHLPKLRWLSLGYNKLTKFDQRLPALKLLSLNGNPLEEFNAGQNAIEKLNLVQTSISRIPEFQNLHAIKDMNLKKTSITTYSTDMLVPFCQLEFFSVSTFNEEITSIDECSCVRFHNWVETIKNHKDLLNLDFLGKICKNKDKCIGGSTMFSKETMDLVNKCVSKVKLDERHKMDEKL